MPVPFVVFGIFKLVTVASGAGFVARIRRLDGQPISLSGESRAALGTKPCPTESAAIDEAKAVIARLERRRR